MLSPWVKGQNSMLSMTHYRGDPAELQEAYLFPIFFLHTMHTFSSVMMHFTCWCKIRSSWTWEGREIEEKSHGLARRDSPN